MTAPLCSCGRPLTVHAADEGTCCYVHADGTPECPQPAHNATQRAYAAPDRTAADALERAEAELAEVRRDLAWTVEKCCAAEAINDAARAFVAASRRFEERPSTESVLSTVVDEDTAYRALVAAVSPEDTTP